MVAGVNFDNDGLEPELVDFLRTATPEHLGNELQEVYARVAPRPGDWPALVAKVVSMNMEFTGWPAKDVQRITAPTMVVIGDHDIVRPEHAVMQYRLLRHAQLAILPGTDHETLMERSDWLVPMITAFLDNPLQAGE